MSYQGWCLVTFKPLPPLPPSPSITPPLRIRTIAPMPTPLPTPSTSTSTSQRPQTSTPHGGSPTSPIPSEDPRMKPISNNTRPLPCHDTPGVSVGLGIITPCLFLSVCLNCFLYKRLKKAENVALFEGFRRSLHRGESDRLLDNDTDDTDDNRRSSYQRDGIRSARTRSLVRPRATESGHVNPAFDAYAVTSL